MLEFAYYPGCSLETTGKPYDQSVREVFKALGIGLKEIEDWNCCGATMYMSVKAIVGFSITARNLALAQNMGLPICAPCSSCYTILRKTNRHIDMDSKERTKINEALAAADLSYDKTVEVRHPLDILVNDLGIEKIAAQAKVKLTGLKVAPYYGCQIVRPNGYFDDVDDPVTMDRLLAGLGADVVYYPNKVRCCGGMLMTTDQQIGMKLNMNLIQAAVDNGADMIATACPLCQINLEAYQDKINKAYDRDFHIPIVYFSHLVGIALGIPAEKMGLNDLVIPAGKLTAKLAEVRR
jgi:heterodisulfide reductase subunit B2